MPRSRLRALGALLPAVLALLMLPAPAAAADTYPSGSAGYDISWPQCGGPYPALGAGWFGIVGVNDGRPETSNPCFADELAWAQQYGAFAGIYVNEAYGQSLDGPASCEAADQGCLAYNYGWMTAQYAYVTGLVNSGGSAESVHSWWLDVELGNTWSDNVNLNARVIQGSLDYFQEEQGIQVGVYSVDDMWQQIAGVYAPPGVPTWIAGGSDMSDFGTCAHALWSGAPAAMFQSLSSDGMFDVDRGC